MNLVFFLETLVLLLQKHAPSLLHAVFTPSPLAVALLLRLHICSPPFTVALLLRLLTIAHHSPRRSSSSSPSLTTHHRRSSSSSLTTHRDIEFLLSLKEKP
ncbi:hypothetical protein HN51_004925 [Arachis hypogaea]